VQNKKSANKGLGKGFESLIPSNFNRGILDEDKDRVQKLFISEVYPNPEQPRKHFDEESLKSLADSIKQHGILQPLIVSPKKGGYVIVAGERRWRSAKIAGLKKVPAIVRKRQELNQLEIALIENVQRVDLSPLEQALSVDRLHNQFSLSFQDIADRLGKAVSTVNNIARLLQLPKSAQKALQENRITEGHARAILSLKDNKKLQAELLNQIISKGWSVRQAEQFVVSAKSEIKKGQQTLPKAKSSVSVDSTILNSVKNKLKTPVTIKRTTKGGRLEIHFKSDKELENIVSKITK
jgi:ParB family transcriptional regulator, chromosome partitioning protein